MDVRQALAMPNRGSIEQWARAGAQSQYMGTLGVLGKQMPIVLCRVLHKYLMIVSATDLSVSPHLMLSGMWEPWVTMAIAKHVKPGMCCLDVGAQQGYYTLLMADLVGEQGHVLSFEPQQWALKCLERSLDANGFRDRVTLSDTAVSDTVGSAVLYNHPYLLGGASLKALDGLGDGYDVDVVTIDSTLGAFADDDTDWASPASPDPDFVKIDVERLESNVLNGMSELLERKRNITLCIEVTGPAAPMAEKYAALGFEVGTVDYDGYVKKFDPKRDERQGDEWQMLWLERK